MAIPAGYKSILDSLTTAVLVLREGLRVQYLNPAAESLFETSVTRSKGAPISDLLIDSEDALKTLHAAAENGQSYTRREAEFVLTSGLRLTVDYSVSPISLEPTEHRNTAKGPTTANQPGRRHHFPAGNDPDSGPGNGP